MAGVFRDFASPGARSYAGTIARDKGTTGSVSADQQVMRFMGRSENQPPLNPYHGRAVVDQTLGDQFGEARYELNVGLQIRNLIRADAEQPWFTIILPLMQTDMLTVVGTIWKYNRRLPTPTPYHAPSPYVTEEFEEFRYQLQRYGESVRMESDYFHTPAGQQNFFLKLTGIASDMVEGIRFDVMRELLRSINKSKRYYYNHTYVENPMRDIMIRVQLFASLNKAPTKSGQLGVIAERLERVLNEAVEGPYEMIVPPEWGIWMNKVNQTPVPQPYYLQGDDGGQLFIRNGPTPKGIIGRNNFWEYQDVRTETGSLPLRLLQRPVSVAEYYLSSFKERGSDLYVMLTGLLSSEKNIGRMRNVYVYSLTENKYIEVRIQDMLAASGIVPDSYDPNDSRSRDYRGLVQAYRQLGASARSKFYPDEKVYPTGQLNHNNQREAPMFLAWEPKASMNGNYFIRVKYSGETDENVTSYEDHKNQGQVLCAHLGKTYGLDRIGVHYANAFHIRRKLQDAPDSIQYWEAFYFENIWHSVAEVAAVSGATARNARFIGSRLSDASDYEQLKERWGVQVYDTIGELATQPGGYYLIPARTTVTAGLSLRIPPGFDCPVGIRSISNISADTSGWDVNFINAVRSHEEALMSMVEQAKKLPESELVNPLNRDPWVHSAGIGAFATAYTNGVSQFRAPIFLMSLVNAVTDSGTLTFDFGTYDTQNKPLYARDPLYRSPGTRPKHDRPTRAVDPVTGSLGADDEDEPMNGGMEPEETILQGLVREYFVDIAEAKDNIDTIFEYATPGGKGLLYAVTYFTDPQDDGTYGSSYVRAVFLGNEVLDTVSNDVASDIMAMVRLVLEEPDSTGTRDTHLVYIGGATELTGLTGLTVPDASVGTTAARANSGFDEEGVIVFRGPPSIMVGRSDHVAADAGFYAESQLEALSERLKEDLEGYVPQTGPIGPGRENVVPATGDGTTLVLTKATTGGDVASTYPIRCALVVTPGMVESGTYRNPASIVRAGNKDTGYTTALLNVGGATPPFDSFGHSKFEHSPLVHGLERIMSKVGRKGYLEWQSDVPHHASHFSFNQVNARLAGMDDDGDFPDTSVASQRHYEQDHDDYDVDGFRRAKGGHHGNGRSGLSSFAGASEEGAGFGKGVQIAMYTGAKEPHSYYDGARRRGRSRFGRRPFAHALDRPFGARYSEGHGRDFGSDTVTKDGKLRKGYRMVRRFNGSNFVAKMTEVTSDPTSPCTFFSIAAMMSRCDRVEHWTKLAKNKLHIACNFLLQRIVEVYAESAILLKAGLGFTVVNNSDYKNGEVTATKTYHGHLTVHYGAFVTHPDHQLMMEDMRLAGYIGGKGGGMITSMAQLQTGSGQRGSSRPSFIVYALPIAGPELPRVLSLSGRMEMDDVLPANMPVQGALFGGVDWHNRRFLWTDIYNRERSRADYFRSKGYTNPLVSFQGWQAIYDLNDGSFKVSSRGEGHLADSDYPGAIHVVNGDVPFFDYPGDPMLF